LLKTEISKKIEEALKN